MFAMFPDDDTAEASLTAAGPTGYDALIVTAATSKTVPATARSTVAAVATSGSPLVQGRCSADSNVGFRNWIIAIYLMTTSLKGVSSMKLHRDLGVTQPPHGSWRIASVKHRQTLPVTRSSGR